MIWGITVNSFYFFKKFVFRNFLFVFFKNLLFSKYIYFFKFFYETFYFFKEFFFISKFLKSFFFIFYNFRKKVNLSVYVFSYFAYVTLLNYLNFDKVFYLPYKVWLKPPKYLELEERLNPDNQVYWEFNYSFFLSFFKVTSFLFKILFIFDFNLYWWALNFDFFRHCFFFFNSLWFYFKYFFFFCVIYRFFFFFF